MDEQKLLQYLADHPDFLTRHHAFLRANHIGLPQEEAPDTNSRANVIDVTSQIANKARLEARRAAQTNQSLLDVATENMLYWQELHLATLGFLACNDLSGFAQMVHEELPLIFGLSCSHLILPSKSAMPQAEALGFITLSSAKINKLIGEDVIKMGKPVKEVTAILSQQAPSVAIMRLPDQLPEPVAGSLLLLGGKEATSFVRGKGRALLLHLSEMVGVCLLSLLEAPHHQNGAKKADL